MSRTKINKDALIGEMVCLHHMEALFETPHSLIKDFLAYNSHNNITSGFTDLKISQSDVGKSVLQYLIEIMPYLARLSKYQYANILELPEARYNSSEESVKE